MIHEKQTLERSQDIGLKQIIISTTYHDNLTPAKREFYTWWIWAPGSKGLRGVK